MTTSIDVEHRLAGVEEQACMPLTTTPPLEGELTPAELERRRSVDREREELVKQWKPLPVEMTTGIVRAVRRRAEKRSERIARTTLHPRR